MATKQIIVAICLMVAVLLGEAGGAIQKKPKTSRARFAQHKKVAEVPKAKIGVYNKAENPDADLTTVREFHFIMTTKQEIVAV
jgi:homoserine acetyltransferase